MTDVQMARMCELVDNGCIKADAVQSAYLSRSDLNEILSYGLTKAGDASAYVSNDISTVTNTINQFIKDYENYKEKTMKKEVLFLAPGWQYAKTVRANLSHTFDKKKIPYVSLPDVFETEKVCVKFSYCDPLQWTEETFRGKAAVFGKKELVTQAVNKFFHVMPATPKVSLEKYLIENTVVATKPAPARTSYLPEIKKVHFSGPATVVLWADGTKTTVMCQEGDIYSEESGLALCIAKKAFGNMPNFNNIFKKHIPEYNVGSKWAKYFAQTIEDENKKTKAIEKAYKKLVEFRDEDNTSINIDEIIGYLGEALE